MPVHFGQLMASRSANPHPIYPNLGFLGLVFLQFGGPVGWGFPTEGSISEQAQLVFRSWAVPNPNRFSAPISTGGGGCVAPETWIILDRTIGIRNKMRMRIRPCAVFKTAFLRTRGLQEAVA